MFHVKHPQRTIPPDAPFPATGGEAVVFGLAVFAILIWMVLLVLMTGGGFG
jgi:hypothetical protein